MDIAKIFSQYGLPALLGIMMFGIGITLKLEDFKRVIVRPKEITIALIGQMIVLPLVAFFIAWVFDFPQWAKIGLILVSACPAGASPNFIMYYLKGRLALAVSATALSSILVLITIPLVVGLALEVFRSQSQDISLPIGETITQIFLTVLIPIVAGVILKEYKDTFTKSLEKVMKWVMPLCLLLIFGGSVYLESGGSIEISKYLNQFPYAVGLNVSAMLISFFLARFVLEDKQSHFTVSTVVGIQNNALAIFIANTLLQRPEMAVIPIVYSSFTFISTAFFAFVAKKLDS